MSHHDQKMLLKACPFCGKTSAIDMAQSKLTGDFQFICNENKGGCGATAGLGETYQNAREMWNNREISEPQKILFDKLITNKIFY